jgi:uncharacterized protein (TIGR02246 family)
MAQLLELVRGFAERYTAAWCSQDPGQVAEHFAPDGSLTVNGGAPAVGHAAIRDVAASFMTAFPDLQVLLDRLAARGQRIEYHWTLVGTYAATGKPVRISGCELWRFGEDGRIAESQGQFDAAEYERQIGV